MWARRYVNQPFPWLDAGLTHNMLDELPGFLTNSSDSCALFNGNKKVFFPGSPGPTGGNNLGQKKVTMGERLHDIAVSNGVWCGRSSAWTECRGAAGRHQMETIIDAHIESVVGGRLLFAQSNCPWRLRKSSGFGVPLLSGKDSSKSGSDPIGGT